MGKENLKYHNLFLFCYNWRSSCKDIFCLSHVRIIGLCNLQTILPFTSICIQNILYLYYEAFNNLEAIIHLTCVFNVEHICESRIEMHASQFKQAIVDVTLSIRYLKSSHANILSNSRDILLNCSIYYQLRQASSWCHSRQRQFRTSIITPNMNRLL